MKSRETKQNDLNALAESLKDSKSAMIVSFNGLTVQKDQEFRESIRAAGGRYQVVKNTLARIAVKGTPYEEVSGDLKGVTALAWTDNDPVVLSKAVSKFVADNADHYTFKSGVVDGKVVDLAQLKTIASLPSKEELISKLLYVLNARQQLKRLPPQKRKRRRRQKHRQKKHRRQSRQRNRVFEIFVSQTNLKS